MLITMQKNCNYTRGYKATERAETRDYVRRQPTAGGRQPESVMRGMRLVAGRLSWEVQHTLAIYAAC
jgi:hypothetical protein